MFPKIVIKVQAMYCSWQKEEEKSVESGTVKGVQLSIQESSLRWVILHYCIIIIINITLLYYQVLD